MLGRAVLPLFPFALSAQKGVCRAGDIGPTLRVGDKILVPRVALDGLLANTGGEEEGGEEKPTKYIEASVNRNEQCML